MGRPRARNGELKSLLRTDLKLFSEHQMHAHLPEERAESTQALFPMRTALRPALVKGRFHDPSPLTKALLFDRGDLVL